MINNNKILTVSYGTFSCTLEGFEDSFGTMKAIAEYFRDLAADDRYFGAEPPQPDAEMLARIAQKEVSRKVSAREQEGKIVLSALEDHSDEPAETPAPAEQTQAPHPQEQTLADAAVMNNAAAVADMETVADAALKKPTVGEIEAQAEADIDATDAVDEIADETPVADEAFAQDIAAAPETSDQPPDMVAEEAPVDAAPIEEALPEVENTSADVRNPAPAVIPAAVSLATLGGFAAAAQAASAETTTVKADEEPATADEDMTDTGVTGTGSVEDINDIVPGQPDAEVEAFFSENATATDAIYDEDETSVAPAADAGGQSIAEKLQRIRAVVAKTQAAPQQDAPDTYVEDEDQSPVPDAAEVVQHAVKDIQDALNADDAAELAGQTSADDALGETEDSAEASAGDDIDAILARLENADGDSIFAETEDDVIDDGELGADSLFAESSSETDMTPDTAEDADDVDAALAASIAKAAAVDTDAAPQMASPEAITAGTETATPRARVIKVKRAALEEAISRGDLEEYSDDDDDDLDTDKSAENAVPALDEIAPSKTDTTSLSREQEQDLARELADLEADIEADVAETDDSDTPERAAPDSGAEKSAAHRGRLPNLDEDSSSDMNRLLAEADHQMDEPESATRRDAFTHLRAAVAAKKADVAMGKPERDDLKDDAYRSDLADVVRPRRPDASASTPRVTPRPDDRRPAPLKLVAEQRIDAGRPQNEGPVRPRRVSRVQPAAEEAQTDTGFAEYAQDLGATTLPQLLEAAASYMSFVEGHDQFSRPQLMTKVRQAGDDSFSREDGLRSFGQLLRAGKIEKIKGGRFTVSDDIGFRPEEQAAG